MRVLKPVVLMAALASVLALPASANAALLVPSAEHCAPTSSDRVFMPWADFANYFPAPNGTLESTDGWELSGGAQQANENEPFFVSGDTSDSKSLRLPPGSHAITAPVCVGVQNPTLRFFARSSHSGLTAGPLAVSVVYESHLGVLEELPVGVALPNRSWSPTLPMTIVANLLPLLPGERTAVQFRFTPVGTAAWYIDDVFVDPWRDR